MPRYMVTATRQVTQYATWIIDADGPDDAARISEDASISAAAITASYDKGGAEDGWSHGTVTEITPAEQQTFRHRLAAALGYGEQPRPPQHQQ